MAAPHHRNAPAITAANCQNLTECFLNFQASDIVLGSCQDQPAHLS